MSNVQPTPIEARLPEALLADFEWQSKISNGAYVVLRVPCNYQERLQLEPGASEVLGIQRLISLAKHCSVRAIWEEEIAGQVEIQPSHFPLLAVLLLLRHIDHFVERGQVLEPLNVEHIRKVIRTHRLVTLESVRSDISVCVEGESQSLSADMYDIDTLKLLPRESFETLAVDLFSAQLSAGKSAREVYMKASLMGTILAELIENSDMHGRVDIDGRLIAQSAVRGVLFRRVVLEIPVVRPEHGHPRTREVECFEASVFDSGVGYFRSYTREPLTVTTDIRKEWMVLHKCLERHFFPELPDQRPAHRGMGLYEVLRALQALKGRMEFRTGRVYAYRTFMEGELQAGMKPRAPLAHLSWPQPRLLDVEKKYLSLPTAQEHLEGSSVRILVPMS